MYPLQGVDTVLISNDTGVTGNQEIVASLSSTGNIKEIMVNGVKLTSGGGERTIFPSYDFTANASILNTDITLVEGQYGVADILFTINPSDPVTGSITIDTRFSEGVDIEPGQKYGKDPYGNILNFNPSGFEGVGVTNTHVTGMIRSEVFGWIDLQPPGEGVTNTVISENKSELDGFAWNDVIGWIYFGKIDDEGGVYIDSEGYFHGTAFSENFGYFSFGDYMAEKKTPDNPGVPSLIKSEWAQTTWRIESRYAPTITQISPSDVSSLNNKTPSFTFRIEDRDPWDTVGYTININKKKGADWYSYQFGSHVADLSANAEYTHTFPELFLPGEYQWEMRAFDNQGRWSDSTGFWTFIIENDGPVISLTTPTEGESIPLGDRRPTFTFSISEGDGEDIRYTVEISDRSDFSVLLPQSSSRSDFVSAGDFSYTPSSNLPKGTLYWRVVATDIYEEPSDTIPQRSFIIQNQVPILQNISVRDDTNSVVPDGGSTKDTTPTIQWESLDPDGVHMETTIEIYEEPNPGPRDPSSDTLAWNNGGNSFSHSTGFQERTVGPLPVGEYYYRLQTCDADSECSSWSSLEGFIIQATIRFGNVGTEAIKTLYPDAMTGPGRHGNPDPSVVDTDSSNNRYAWNDAAGWIDMNPIGGGVVVKNDNLQGYAWSNAVGWIRMNCQAFDEDIGIVDGDGDPIGDECSSNNYGVSNNNGDLTGKALIESTGKFLYFDEASYIADFGGGPHTDIDVNISCDEDFDGHFYGWGYAPDLGWVAFGRSELVESGSDINPAADVFSMTEWSCDFGAGGPELAVQNIYTILSAKNEDFSFPIAHKNPLPFSEDVVCDSNDGSEGTQVELQRMNPDGTVDTSVSLLNGIDFSIGCLNTEGHPDGSIWLTLRKNSPVPKEIRKTPGLYRIIGDVASVDGKITSFPQHVPDEAHDFVNDPDDPGADTNDEYIIHVVAGEPDMAYTQTIQHSKHDSNGILAEEVPLIADGDDSFRINIELFDTFGNPVVAEYKYKNIVYTQLKSVSLRIVFWDDVNIDQVEGTANVKEAVSFSGHIEDTSGSGYDGGHPAVKFVDTSDSPNILVDISSIAPTDSSYSLQLQRLEAIVQQTIFSENRFDLGQTDAYPGQIKSYNPSGLSLSFHPIISSVIGDIGEVFSTGGVPGNLPVTLSNESDVVDVFSFDWFGMMRTKKDGGIPGDTEYTDTTLRWPSETSPALTPMNMYWQEVSTILGTFIAGTNSQFPFVIDTKTNVPSPIKRIHDQKFPSISPEDSHSFFFTATPILPSPLPDPFNETPEFLQYIALEIGGKIVKIPLQFGVSNDASGFIKLAISGSTHGEHYEDSIIVGEGDTDEFTKVGRVYNRREIRNIMYENYKSITGLRLPKLNNKAGATNNEREIISSWSDLNSERTVIPGQYRSLQDGKIVWYERNELSDSLTVVLGDNTDDPVDNPFIIPSGKGPITLIIRGGNLFIRDDIFIGEGSNLGIIMLSSREYSSEGKEGNIIIDPSVTHLEGVFYADGSFLSGIDYDYDGSGTTHPNGIIEEEEVFDGFVATGGEFTSSDFGNQLFIKGSIVSQNTVGGTSSSTIPVDAWQPYECISGECTDCSDTGLICSKNAAMRYDFSFMRRFKLGNSYDDEDSDTIKNSADCDYNPGLPSCVDTILPNPDPVVKYNTVCEDYNPGTGVVSPKSPLPEECERSILGKTATNSGRCAIGTPWCTGGNERLVPFTFDCDSANCDSEGNLLNNKQGASVLIEFNPNVRKIIPVGMNLPSVVNFQ
jgi:hypothetical protein